MHAWDCVVRDALVYVQIVSHWRFKMFLGRG